MGFASGFMAGAGAVNAYEDRKRRERLDKRDDELHAQKMEDIARAKKDRDTVAQAGKLATTNESAATLDLGAGAKTYDMADASNVAASDARQFRRDTANTTGIEPTLAQPQQAFTVNGNPVADRASMVKTAADYNAPQARNARLAQAFNDTGRPVEAMQLEASGRQAQAADMQIKAAEVAQAREAFNSTAQDTFRTAGVFNGAAKLLTDTNAGGLAGSKFEAAPSKDGKTMEFYRIAPDGARVLHNTVPNSKEGELQVIQSFLKVSPDKVVDWHADALKRASDAEQRAQTQANSDRDFGLRKSESESQTSYRSRMLSLQEKQEGRAAATHARTLEDYKIPQAVKLQAESLSERMKGIGTAINKAMAENNFDATSDNAKALLMQQATLGIEYSKLISPYTPAGKAVDTGLPGANAFDTKPEAPAAKVAPALVPRASPSMTEVTGQQQFNAAGYADVQSTIDGAKRGDQKARALLDVLIRRGVTTPAQRQQIQSIPQ